MTGGRPMSDKKAMGGKEEKSQREESRELLVSGAAFLGAPLETMAVEAFEQFLDALVRWNQKMNLTGLHERRAIVVRHFLDSLTLVKELPAEGRLLDIGSGAGFPGIPLKIAIPGLHVTLLEAARKKTYFHRHVIRSLKLPGIQTIWGRSDQDRTRADLGHHFDVVVSRATLPLEAFLEDGTHFVHPRGVIIAMRGKDRRARVPPASLCLELWRRVSVDLPFDRIQRNLLFFRRTEVQR